MTRDMYMKLLPYYWIADFRAQKDRCDRVRHFKFGLEAPRPVDNPNMMWMKPTYEQLSELNKSMMEDLLDPNRDSWYK